MTEGKYSALTIALYVISQTNHPEDPLGPDNGAVFTSNLRLHFILYFVQAYFLLKTGSPAFWNKIEAWDFGPVVPCVYKEFASYGALRIYIDPAEGIQAANSISAPDKALIDDVVKECSKYSIHELMEMTHKLRVWRDANPCYDQTITIESMRKYIKLST